MTQLRKEVRTLSLRQPRYFDDQLWPTNVALMLWATGAAAAAIVNGAWHDPRPWANTWVQLISILVALGGALWAVRGLGPRLQQRIKFCLVLSLALHTALATALAYHHLRPFAHHLEPAELAVLEVHYEADSPPEVVVQPPPVGDERREIDRPLVTGVPRPLESELDAARSSLEMLEQIRQAHDVAAAQPVTSPQVARLERQDQLPALRAATPGERSRREPVPAESKPSLAETIAESSPAAARRSLEPVPDTSQLARAAVAVPNVPPSPATPPAPELLESPAPPRAAETAMRPEEMMARMSRPRRAEEPARVAHERIARETPEPAVSARPSAALRAQRDALERVAPTAPQLTSLPADARPAETAAARVAMVPRQPLLTPMPEVARDTERTDERRRVELATLPELEVTTRELAEQSVTQGRQVAEAQPTSVELARQSRADVASSFDLPSAVELASTPRPVEQATPTRIARAEVPSIHTNRSDVARSREDGRVAELATSGSEQLRDVPTPTAPAGLGGGQTAAAGLRAETESISLARAAAAIASPQPRGEGSEQTTAAGQLAQQHLPQRRRAEAVAGAQPGGSAVRPRPSSEVAAISAAAALPSRVAGSPVESRPSPTSPMSPGDQVTAVASATERSTAPPTSALLASEAVGSTDVAPGSVALAGGTLPPTARSTDAGRLPVVEGPASALPRREYAEAAPLAGTAQINDSPAATTDADGATMASGGRAGSQPVASTLALGRTENLVPVLADAPEGDGGLGPAPSRVVGLPDRRATRDAPLAHAVPPRMIRKSSGGTAGIEAAARVPASAFARRGRRLEEIQSGGEGRPSAKTEAAIELGLEFLARVQLEDGHWSFEHLGDNADFAPDGQPTLRADAAATGLALLAFLGAGYDHFEDKYQAEVQAGLNYLTRIQATSGELFPEANQPGSAVTRFYGHGIATLALCEAFGMTGDAELREPAQRALQYIANTQHPQHGGWRYVPGVNSDLSVTGWQLMALRSGQLAGLEVRPETFQRVQELVDACRGDGANQVLFRYNPWASATDPRTRHGRRPSTVMTAVGLLSQLYLGSNRDDETMQRGADHLLKNLPMQGYSQSVAPTGTLENPLRDTYYWYYATQVMFHMGGNYWRAWNDRLHPTLVDTQTPVGPLAGSWNPRHPVPDKWGAFGGRIYVTTMNLLSLEVYYRHLPLYEMTAK